VGCLDVKLDDELARFRHLQGREKTEKLTTAPTLESSTWEQQTKDYDLDSGIVSAEFVRPIVTNTTLDDDDYEVIPPPLPAVAPPPVYQPFDLDPPEISVAFQPLDLDYTRGGEIAPFQGEDYLEASERLRAQAIAEEVPAPAAATIAAPAITKPKPQFFTPWKVGSIAAIAAIAGGATYLFTHPAILSPQVATVLPPTSVLPGQKIQSPDLAASDFTDLNLSTITTIQPQVATAPAPAPVAAPVAAPAPAPAATNNAPTAIPYNPTQPIAPPKLSTQPKLSDSLMRSLLPQNLQQAAKQISR
jgi:hypothetical protein